MTFRASLLLATKWAEDWKPRLAPSTGFEWSRTNSYWEGRAIIGGRVSKNHQNVVLTVNHLRQPIACDVQGADPIRQDQSAPCHPARCNAHEVIPS
ncbi:DNA sulfur modification protein DndB [Nonomuraea sp. NPDC047897]|uniref:DNA sulfur modification protein DndB n=1 Tax=Nonomuraea sp. NPDC047897 TaxID=3364346 RepID=UPI003711C967